MKIKYIIYVILIIVLITTLYSYWNRKPIETFSNISYQHKTCGVHSNEFIVSFADFVKRFDQTYSDNDDYSEKKDLKKLKEKFINSLTYLLLSDDTDENELGFTTFYTNHLIFKAFFHKYFITDEYVKYFDDNMTSAQVLELALNGGNAKGVNNPGLRSIHRNMMNSSKFTNMYKDLNTTQVRKIVSNITTKEYKTLLDEPFLVIPVLIPRESVLLTPNILNCPLTPK
jgi:hypothetical protein